MGFELPCLLLQEEPFWAEEWVAKVGGEGVTLTQTGGVGENQILNY